ncbi:MAG: hypothetical protein ACI36Y_05845 [Coriobacteriales bacterium]
MKSRFTEEERRQVVAGWAASGLTQAEYARQAGVPAGRLSSWCNSLYQEGDLDPFILSPWLSACPAMARTAKHHANPQVRGYLKEVHLEILRARKSKDGPGQLTPYESKIYFAIESVLTGSPHPAGISTRDLERLAEKTLGNTSGTAYLQAAVLAALKTGFFEPHPFFGWAAEHEKVLRELQSAGAVIAEALEDGAFERMRITRDARGRFEIFKLECGSPFCTDLLDGFLASERCAANPYTAYFCEHFSESLGFAAESLADFTPATFGRQLEWLRDNSPSKSAQRYSLMVCRTFYLHIAGLLPEDQTAFTFETGLPPRGLAYKFIASRWLEGYRCALHEPLDPVPAFPKIIAFPNADEALNSSVDEGRPFLLDCSMADREMEAVLMRWCWLEESVKQTSASLSVAKRLSLAISQGERGEGGSFAVVPRMVRDVLSGGRKTARTTGRFKSVLKGFLEHCEEEGFDVQPGCWLPLETTSAERDQNSGKEVGAVSEEHLAMLAARLEEKASESLDDELAYIAFIVQALTDLRASEVCGLRVADIDAGPRNGVKAVRVCRKTSGKAFQKVQVTEEIHRLLQAAARITAPVRERADAAIAGYLFLYEDVVGNPLVMSQRSYARRIETACKELKIPRVIPANIRKRYMTTGIQEGLKAGIGRIALLDITGHADMRSDAAYLRPDIMSPETRAYLEGSFLVDLDGCCETKGEVLPDSELPEEVRSLVEGGAGICRSTSCNVAGSVPCPMCAGFATSPRYIPEMLDAIATVDEKMRRASPHDREHLLDAKCAYLAYLGKMIDKEKEEQHG